MQILAACTGTIREQASIARAKSVQFVPRMSRDQANENPATSAKVNGAKDVLEGVCSFEKHNPKRVGNAISDALTLGVDGDVMAGLVAIFCARLSEGEKAGLAYAALRSMDEKEAYKTASMAIFGTLQGEAVQ